MSRPVPTPLRPARADSPSVVLVRADSGPLVRKSYAHCPLPLRETVGRWAVARECWALTRLDFSLHSPRLLSRPNRYSLESEYIEGRPVESLRPGDVDPEELAEQVDSLLSDFARAGVAHGDLGHDHWQDMGRETNLIWTGRRLVAIDFAGALPLESRIPLVRNAAHALSRHDRLLKTKIAYHFPGSTTARSEGLEWPLELWSLLRLMGKV